MTQLPPSQVGENIWLELLRNGHGTWENFTPTLTFATPGDLSVEYSGREARQMRVGNAITVVFSITTSTFTHTTASGNLQIIGLQSTATGVRSVGSLIWQGITKTNYTHIEPRILVDTAIIILTASGSAQNVSNVGVADVPTGGTISLQGSITYEVN